MRYGFYMSTITLKNVSPRTHRALKTRAKAHGRSLNKEIIATLETTIGSTRINTAEIIEHAREVRETMEVFLSQTDLRTLKNNGRK
ncbi:MAG TPA: Arc family DNA-binding protein [Verrucomicrobiales bacterium]|jgi:plasmid stability protein|nr:Arc family DNA-binding protein [Verrucomicrobiales bacterium]